MKDKNWIEIDIQGWHINNEELEIICMIFKETKYWVSFRF